MNTVERFSKTVRDYSKYRPGYPKEILRFLEERLGLRPKALVADIGSGTGKLTELFLENGNTTYAIEPNTVMRQAAEARLEGFENFRSIDGTAEQTSLPDRKINFITAAQAFHWFDVERTRREFVRILRPEGWVVLIWNKRVDECSPFMRAYNNFLKAYSTDYSLVNLRKVSDRHLSSFYGHHQYALKCFENEQIFDQDGLLGRYFSCSYALDADHPLYSAAKSNLSDIFTRFSEKGKVVMIYRTEVYYGQLRAKNYHIENCPK